jgi:hypothetical protein
LTVNGDQDESDSHHSEDDVEDHRHEIARLQPGDADR